RDGNGENGPGSEDVGGQHAQPGVGCPERLHDRWGVHGVERESESEHHLYGHDGEGGGLRSGSNEKAGAVALETVRAPWLKIAGPRSITTSRPNWSAPTRFSSRRWTPRRLPIFQPSPSQPIRENFSSCWRG